MTKKSSRFVDDVRRFRLAPVPAVARRRGWMPWRQPPVTRPRRADAERREPLRIGAGEERHVRDRPGAPAQVVELELAQALQVVIREEQRVRYRENRPQRRRQPVAVPVTYFTGGALAFM